jgi:hypothetical protein
VYYLGFMKNSVLYFMSPISIFFNFHAAFAAPQNEYNGLIPQSLREREVADICTRLELNYSGWQLKARIKQGEGFLLNPESKRAALPVADGKRICEHFLEKEKNAADPDLDGLSNEERKFRVAKSNLEYSDRLQSLIASFKDSHLSIWRSTPRAEIFYGFELKEIAGNFYISDISPTRKFSWSETLGLDAPKVGDRVSSWNGQKIESVLKPLMKQVAGIEVKNVLCVIRNPTHPPLPPPGAFEFLGYDLVDRECTVSALTNCGGFADIFSNSELSGCGLLSGFERAVEVQQLLRSSYPNDRHANCHLWAIFRLVTLNT